MSKEDLAIAKKVTALKATMEELDSLLSELETLNVFVGISHTRGEYSQYQNNKSDRICISTINQSTMLYNWKDVNEHT